MSIISFWSNGPEETGKSSTIAALTTYLGVHHNYKILVINTKYNDYFYQDCYWKEDKTLEKIKNSNDAKTDIGHGISGLSKAILSNKTSPEIVTNYTKIVFKNRLELLMDTKVEKEEYEIHKTIFRDIAKIASKYYDLVFIDIDSSLEENIKDSLLEISNLVVACMPQKLRTINDYLEVKEQKEVLKDKAILPLLGRYDKHSKFNIKNVSRYMKEKRGVCAAPYNTLFMEACSEGTVADYFIKFRRINEKDRNAIFISEIRKLAEKMVERLKELQMRM
ncbi:MAG: hypothetical protein J5507_02325 [Clostridia bacterium]|nr:hypothetical protein [Clostridia bacterium]